MQAHSNERHNCHPHELFSLGLLLLIVGCLLFGSFFTLFFGSFAVYSFALCSLLFCSLLSLFSISRMARAQHSEELTKLKK